MSWVAYLVNVGKTGDGKDWEHTVGEWDYTHNTGVMLRDAFNAATGQRMMDAWWRYLDGLDKREGETLLGQIIDGLRSDPARFKAMNPSNGWGSYDGVLKVLQEMLAKSVTAVIPAGTTLEWKVSG